MKILLFGNIGSGKTTIAKELSQNSEQWTYLAVDDFRREIGDGSIKGDAKAKSAFVKSISHDEQPQLIECTGLGRLGSSVFRRLQKYDGPLIVMVLKVAVTCCEQRIEKRDWDIPFPKEISQGTELVYKLNKLYESRFLFERWGLRKNTNFFYHMNEIPSDKENILSILSTYMKKS